MSIRQNGKIIAGKMENKPHYIGEIFCGNYSANYIPDGAVPANGGEYLATQFPELWDNYLNCSPSKLQICSYTEFDADVKKIGSCINWAIDTVKKSFRVPLISEGTFLESGNGEIHEAGLPNINVTTHKHTHNRGSMNITGWIASGTWFEADRGQEGGALYRDHVNHGYKENNGGTNGDKTIFDASRAWTGNTSEDSHTHTLTNNVLGKSTTVQPKSVGIKYYVQIANGSIDKSMIDWAKYMAGLETKVNRNGSETINGEKKFTGDIHTTAGWPFIKDYENSRQDTIPSIQEWTGIGLNRAGTYSDGGDGYVCWLNGRRQTDGANITEMAVRQKLAGKAESVAAIGVAVDKNNYRWSWAPTSAYGASGDEIATCNWVRQHSCLIESKYNADYWYRKYSDGWTEQGGLRTLNENQIIDVTLLKPMKDTNYTVIASQNDVAGNNTEVTVTARALSTTQVRLRSSYTNPNTIKAYWYACGLGA